LRTDLKIIWDEKLLTVEVAVAAPLRINPRRAYNGVLIIFFLVEKILKPAFKLGIFKGSIEKSCFEPNDIRKK
jgi:hypothetical protein